MCLLCVIFSFLPKQLMEWRREREEQDREYAASLEADTIKERDRKAKMELEKVMRVIYILIDFACSFACVYIEAL